MQIFVRPLVTGKLVTWTLDVDGSTTVDSIMEIVQQRLGIPPNRQRLICGGDQLENGRTLADYKVREYSTIYLILRMGGGHCEVCGPKAQSPHSGTQVQSEDDKA
ncbi:hypothetical protein ACP70R_043123 [Stipagrostis hirtigluma subsp. patula]